MVKSPRAELLRQATELLVHATRDHDSHAALPNALRDLAGASTLIDELKTQLVVELKSSWVSWTDIGGCLGVTRQAARQRYAAAVDAAWQERMGR